MKTKTIPFDLETAKKIQAGEIKGRIVAENIKGILFPIRIICYDAKYIFPIVGLALDPSGNEYIIRFGKSGTNLDDVSIHIELPEEAPKYTLEDEKVVYKQYKNSSILLDKILKNVGCDFNEKEKESFEIVKKYLDDIISMQANRLEETPKHEFKPFDKVLVRNENGYTWFPRLYERYSETEKKHYCQDRCGYNQCLPYEGNEHFVGTTDKPKED